VPTLPDWAGVPVALDVVYTPTFARLSALGEIPRVSLAGAITQDKLPSPATGGRINPVPVLRVSHLRRSFGAVHAVDDVSFEVLPGQVVSIIGPNGSGKTTTINLLTGLLSQDDGSIEFDGRRIERLSAEQRAEFGLARTFQNGRVFANMAVADNVVVGLYAGLEAMRPWPSLRHVPGLHWASLLSELGLALLLPRSVRREMDRVRARTATQLERFGERLSPRAERPAFSLSYANRRRTEIARALASTPRVLLLDEPTAGMNRPKPRRFGRSCSSSSTRASRWCWWSTKSTW
jgi:branched-chain amino acid transport system ATP-binding protein